MDASGRAAIDSDTVALASGSVVNLVGGVTNAVCSFAFTFLIARELHASRAGAFYEAIAVFSVLTIVSQLGAPWAVVRTISQQRALGTLANSRLAMLIAVVPPFILSCLFAGLVFAGARPLSDLLVKGGSPATGAHYMRAFATVLPFAVGGNIVLAGTQGLGTMVPNAVVDTIIKPASRVVIAVVCFWAFRGSIAASISWIVPIVLAFALALIALSRLLRSAVDVPTSRATSQSRDFWVVAGKFWRFALPQSLTGVVGVGLVWLDVILLGALRTSHEAGVYATLSRYLLVGMVGLSAVGLAISPLMSGLITSQAFSRARTLYSLGTAWLCALAFPVYIITGVFSPLLMRLFGSSFVDGARPLTILSFAMLANVSTGPVILVLLMGGKSSSVLVYTVAAFAMNLALNLLLIPTFGMTGAATAWAVSIVVVNGLSQFRTYRLWDMHPLGRELVLICTSALAFFGVVGFIATRVVGMDLLSLAVTCCFGAALHGLVVWRLRLGLGSAALRAAWLNRRSRIGQATT